jgi:hypothetical protein
MDKRYLITKMHRFGEYKLCEILSEAEQSYSVWFDVSADQVEWTRVKKADVLVVGATPELFEKIQDKGDWYRQCIETEQREYLYRLGMVHKDHEKQIATLLAQHDAAHARADEQ